MILNPEKYNTEANIETISNAKNRLQNNKKRKIGKYPLTSDFKNDLSILIKNHIAVNLAEEEKFISHETEFFTMGSCFARNISTSLIKTGYKSQHMEISEYINTTFSNKIFVDYLEGNLSNSAIEARLEELLPSGWTRESTIKAISKSQVFILTLGVAPAFFDANTGEFVLPRPSSLNSRTLAEKYKYRNTSVKENVENVKYLIKFIRRLSPQIKIIVTVSPVPLLASFHHESTIQADCLSKCTMRLVAHEIVCESDIKNIIYWPSFEIFRWAGSNSSDYYAADDGAAWHVSEDKVSTTINSFVDMFSS
jgi:hypothetical protein